ncbi:hypothetical protein A1Q1_07575 [Trichosporon asahii var. asahii CBS 2479]|uniref:Uncharacterized protein n=1 Tax=Trichosporon asahii var. asahii (strain ATCC 90039 / CBS 2479 / JCM 2466 / KCTC 7840 / NBRC 103889/ NCYC 2677 / UAMH 7654) TaxID=1186058 RepID=J5R882_TRIAS|nr:hypothetical protein A1Q1_07575 [Trichosporon asahii var. asahii CBS 2479]EJT51218.1 hypothetical protein A1Q1_07575 [Trichosporon asahii var. asahii CBS 2479]
MKVQRRSSDSPAQGTLSTRLGGSQDVWIATESLAKALQRLQTWSIEEPSMIVAVLAHQQECRITWRYTRSLGRRHDSRDHVPDQPAISFQYILFYVSVAPVAPVPMVKIDRSLAAARAGWVLPLLVSPPGPVATAVRHDRQINDQISMEAFPVPLSPSPAFL